VSVITWQDAKAGSTQANEYSSEIFQCIAVEPFGRRPSAVAGDVFFCARQPGADRRGRSRASVNQRFPGSVNVSLFDGQVENCKLDGLWFYMWSGTYVPLPKRPGLP